MFSSFIGCHAYVNLCGAPVYAKLTARFHVTPDIFETLGIGQRSVCVGGGCCWLVWMRVLVCVSV